MRVEALLGALTLCACGARTGLLVDSASADTDAGVDAAAAFDAAHPLWQLAAGGGHACLLADGRVRCWGNNDSGQLGDGTTTNRSMPVAVALPPTVEIGLSSVNSCARLEDETVRCWGWNSRGEVGTGTVTMAPVLSPARVAVSGVVGLGNRGNGDHFCVRIADGTAACWGADFGADFGEPSSDGQAQPVPTRVASLMGATVIAVGGFYTCAIFPDAWVQCVGQIANGQPANGMVGAAGGRWGRVAGLSGVIALSASNWHACAVMRDRTLQCWGVPFASGIPGDGGKPTPVPGISSVLDVVCAGFSTCALLMDHTVACWGNNHVGELGDGTTIDRVVPAPVPGLTSVQQIAGGDGSFCALLADGAVRCWGSNKFGQIGDGTNIERHVPTAVSFP